MIVQEKLGSIKLAHIDQNESDANLMTRIADEHDAIATVKNGTLLFMAKGKSEDSKWPNSTRSRNYPESGR